MKPWLVYARVSTEEQGSIAAQLDGCRAMLRVMGITSADEIIDDGESAKDLERPGVQRVLAAVDASAVSGVVVWKLDRLTRSLRDLLDVVARFKAAGVELASVQERLDTSTPMGRMVVHILGTFAQFEREVIAERVKMGMRHLRARGFFVGARVPPGCKVDGPPRQRVLVPDPETAADVGFAWELVLKGKSLRDVADHIARMTGGGRPMTPSGVQRFLANERLIGVLVDRDLFERVQAELGKRFSPRRGRGIQHQTLESADAWPLRGILRCTTCGALMVGITVRNGSGHAYRYLRCGERARHGRASCPQKDIPAEPMEAAMIEALHRAVIQERRLPAILASRKADLDARVAPAREKRIALHRERDRLDTRRANLAEQMAEGGAMARGLRPAFLELVAQVEHLDGKLAALDGEIAASEIGAGSVETIAALFDAAVHDLEHQPLEDQVEVVRSLVRSARVVHRDGEDGVDFELNLPANGNASGEPGAFVGQWPLVEHGPLPTIAVRTSVRVRTLREWNARSR